MHGGTYRRCCCNKHRQCHRSVTAPMPPPMCACSATLVSGAPALAAMQATKLVWSAKHSPVSLAACAPNACSATCWLEGALYHFHPREAPCLCLYRTALQCKCAWATHQQMAALAGLRSTGRAADGARSGGARV